VDSTAEALVLVRCATRSTMINAWQRAHRESLLKELTSKLALTPKHDRQKQEIKDAIEDER
jgi:hypothetical protein